MKLDEVCTEFIVRPSKKVEILQLDPDYTSGFKEEESKEILDLERKRLTQLQTLMYAEHQHSLLIVLQGVDTSGKDGTISHVMNGVNPLSCKAYPFKVPTPEELDHDFLWRIHKVTPAKGEIVIFNRSHYEDVLVARVHNLVPENIWNGRYELINSFERLLSEGNTKILKFFLNISKDEQKKRFLERIDDPMKNWKLSPNDFRERECWGAYMKAYEDVLNRCSTDYAPWYAVPSNKKWFRNVVISRVINDTLESLDMKFPKSSMDLKSIKID